MNNYILLGLACGIIAAAAAPGRGRRAWIWFFIGYLFGPLAVGAVFFMGKVHHCPTCYSKVDGHAKVCRYCGAALVAPTEGSVTAVG